MQQEFNVIPENNNITIKQNKKTGFYFIEKESIIYENGKPIRRKISKIKINSSGQYEKSNGKNVILEEYSYLVNNKGQAVFKHPKSEYSYIIIQNKNKNGEVIDKFVKVNKEKKPMKDGENFIYLNKKTGEAINNNGKKYKLNINGQMYLTNKGYIKINNNNNNSLPKRSQQPIKPSRWRMDYGEIIPSPSVWKMDYGIPS